TLIGFRMKMSIEYSTLPLALRGANSMSVMMALRGSDGSSSPKAVPRSFSYWPTVPKAVPTNVGATLMHEHIVTRSPGVHENWPHLFDRERILAIAERKMADLHGRGIRAIVDLTTVDLGRDIDLIVDVARRSRVHVIVATGVWWMPQRYFSAHGVDAVAELFIRDITRGIGTSGVKAAIIKCATDTAGVTPVIENILRASARAQKATGVPISTHTWAAGRSGEAQQAIFAQE